MDKMQPNLYTQPELHHLKNFTISYKDSNGSVLHGFVKQVNVNDYEIFIQEKDVIIHCSKDVDGVLSCRLDSYENPDWLDAISKKLAKRLVQYRGKF